MKNACLKQQFTEPYFYNLISRSATGDLPLKLLDVILFEENQPVLWLFTDTQGNLNTKPLTDMLIDDLIKAIISNIEGINQIIKHQDILVIFPY